jgi:hypothetical protein
LTLPVLSRRELSALLVLFALTLPAVTARLYSSDEVQYYAYLRSLWFDGDVSFENEYRYFYDRGVARTPGFEDNYLLRVTPTGHRENFATLGAAVLWAPFYLVADVVTRLLRLAGSELPADGYSRLYIAAVAFGSAIYGFAALLLSIRAARQLAGDGLVGGLAVWFGTPLLFYMYAAPPFSHACSAFAVALFVTIWLRVRERWSTGGLMLLGASAALMAMVREQDVFYAIAPAADFAMSVFDETRNRREPVHSDRLARRLVPLAAGVGTFLVAYLPQLLAYVVLNGRPGPSQLVTRKMTWTAPHALEVLGSPEHGLFVWTPLALLAVIGLVLLWAGRPADATAAVRRISGCMLLMILFQVYVSGSVESWTVAGAFGQRRFVGATILLVIGVAAFWQSMAGRSPRTIAAALIVLAIWWNVGLMALFGAGLMDRQRLNPRQNAYDVFVTLPTMLPSLVYRYLFDRRSFYQTPQ